MVTASYGSPGTSLFDLQRATHGPERADAGGAEPMQQAPAMPGLGRTTLQTLHAQSAPQQAMVSQSLFREHHERSVLACSGQLVACVPTAPRGKRRAHTDAVVLRASLE